MIVIPAIDIKGGRCVRLYKGDFSKETVFSDNPVDVALRWQELGAAMLHVVDLDGAKCGRPVHGPLIASICKAVRIPVQVGGGIRNLDNVSFLLDQGAARVVLGTFALSHFPLLMSSEAWGNRIAVSLDVRNGFLATHGWQRTSNDKVDVVARELADNGVKCLVYTDINRDGTLAGPNVDGAQAVLLSTSSRVDLIVAGGITTIDDLLRLGDVGVAGAIVGRALYTGAINLREWFGTTQQ